MSQTVNLFSIRPDPNQPRSLLPPELGELFKTGLMSPQVALQAWQKEQNQAFLHLVTLADSIAQHGLINPISVRMPNSYERTAPGVEYLIVTGERRWWAHVLLVTRESQIQEGDLTCPPNQIKINLTAKGTSIRAHQLIENLIREDINAIEKAHGMWALRYELSGMNYSSPPTTDEARALGLVGWIEVEKSLGISSRYRQYVVSTLRLCEKAQKLIQEHNFSESMIRPIAQKLHEHPSQQMLALEQLVAWQQDAEKHSLVREVRNLVDKLLVHVPKEAPSIPKPNLLPLSTTPRSRRTGRTPTPDSPMNGTTTDSLAAPRAQALDAAQATLPAAPQPPTVPPTAPYIGEPEIPRGTKANTPTQSSLFNQPQTLRTRRATEIPILSQFSDASLNLLSVVDLINPSEPEHRKKLAELRSELESLQTKITHLLSNT